MRRSNTEFKAEEKIGYSTTCRKIVGDVLFDTNTNMQDFPYNYNDLSLKFELESKFINVKGIKKGEEVEEKVEFGYIILDSTIPTNVYSVK